MAFVPVFTKLIISGWHYVDSFHTVFRQNPLINKYRHYGKKFIYSSKGCVSDETEHAVKRFVET